MMATDAEKLARLDGLAHGAAVDPLDAWAFLWAFETIRSQQSEIANLNELKIRLWGDMAKQRAVLIEIRAIIGQPIPSEHEWVGRVRWILDRTLEEK